MNRKLNPLKNLSQREKEVLTLMVDSKTSTEIAVLLQISKRTVDSHRIHIHQKTGAKSIIELFKMLQHANSEQ